MANSFVYHKKEKQKRDRNEYTDNYTDNLNISKKELKPFNFLYDPIRSFSCFKDKMKLLFCKISFGRQFTHFSVNLLKTI